jgi:hypothetical protein
MSIYVVPYDRYRTIVRKHMDRRADKRDGLRRISHRTRHGGPEFIASDFSSKVQSRGISRFRVHPRVRHMDSSSGTPQQRRIASSTLGTTFYISSPGLACPRSVPWCTG